MHMDFANIATITDPFNDGLSKFAKKASWRLQEHQVDTASKWSIDVNSYE